MEANPKLKSDSLRRKPSAVWVAMKTVKTKLSLTDKDATPVNWKVTSLVFLSLFTSTFNITFIFPFLPEMVMTFGYKEEEKGFYAGLVASALFFGRILGSYFWGWLSDKKGRKPVVLVTILLNGMCSLCFGFTTNIYFAFFTRVLAGLVNGVVGTSQSILYEISDNTNQAVSMSMLAIAWGSGLIVGPAIGGYLANPCKLYPGTFPSEGFLLQFPYFFPGLAAFVICVIALVLDFIWLPETLNSKKNSEKTLGDDNDFGDERTSLHSCHSIHHDLPSSVTASHLRVNRPKTALSVENLHVESEGATYLADSKKEILITMHGSTFTDNPESKEEARILKEDDKKCNYRNKGQFYVEVDNARLSSSTTAFSSEKNSNEHKIMSKDDDDDTQATLLVNSNDEDVDKLGSREHPDEESASCCNIIKNWSPIKLIRQYEVFLAVMLYAILSFSDNGVDELFTVWASTDVTLDGLGFEPQQIGTVLGSTAVPLLFLQLFVFPNLIRRLGIKKTLISCSILLGVLTDALPVLHLLVNRPVTLWVLLLSGVSLRKLIVNCTFSCTALLINNSVTPGQAGSVNGLATTLTAVSRSLAPVIGGSIFSWVVGYASENIGPPFDVSLVFFVLGIVYWVVAAVGLIVPDSMNKQKK